MPPLRSEGWVSIERYVDAIVAHAALGRLSTTVSQAPRPKRAGAVARYRARYRDYSDHVAERGVTSDVSHIADQALGHLVPALTGPTVVTCHDLMPLAAEGHYSSRFDGWLDRTLLHLSLEGMTAATRIIAVSQATADEVVRLLQIPSERISVVPNMVGSGFSPLACAEDWLSAREVSLPERPRILSVGHSRPYKNLETLIRALAQPVLREASLVRCGARLTDSQRRLAADLGIRHRIVELGHRRPLELRAIYSACDVLAQPSRAEGFGVPVVEAMACGLPVVCSDTGALAEVAGGAARIAPLTGAPEPDAASVLAAALGDVLGDGAQAGELRRAGLARAEVFAPENVVPRLRAAYERTIEEFEL